jgi:predicted nucleic acid-binding protein
LNGQSAYLDASALVKLVLVESETDALIRELGDVETLYTSELAVVEVGRAVRRIAGDERGYEHSQWVLDGCVEVELDDGIKHKAARSETSLATLDAIHLESALSIRTLVDAFITYDLQLAAAARMAGLPVTSPGRDS